MTFKLTSYTLVVVPTLIPYFLCIWSFVPFFLNVFLDSVITYMKIIFLLKGAFIELKILKCVSYNSYINEYYSCIWKGGYWNFPKISIEMDLWKSILFHTKWGVLELGLYFKSIDQYKYIEYVTSFGKRQRNLANKGRENCSKLPCHIDHLETHVEAPKLAKYTQIKCPKLTKDLR